MIVEPRIAFDDLDAHPLVRAISDLAAHPGDEHAAHRVAAELFGLEVTVPAAIAALVLGSEGAFATLARKGIEPGDRRRARVARELTRLGEFAHADLESMLDSHGLADAMPPDIDDPAPGHPPAFIALRTRLRDDADWGALAEPLGDFYALQGTGALASHRVLRFSHGSLVGVPIPDPVTPGDLIGGTAQRAPLAASLDAFLDGAPANDALLYGPPGTGKSVAVRALGRGEKAALATRFGLRVAFTQLTQDRYIEMATGLVARLGGSASDTLAPAALRFARGGHGLTPRTARQFAVAWVSGTVPAPPD